MKEKLRPFFWDIKFDTLDLNKNKQFIIARLMSFGNDECVKWMYKYYTEEDIISCAKNSRQFTKQAAYFLKNVYNLKEEEMKYFVNAKALGDYYFI
ncbi:MAG: hypothetical protein RSE41_08545 [Clostridia bacterium]